MKKESFIKRHPLLKYLFVTLIIFISFNLILFFILFEINFFQIRLTLIISLLLGLLSFLD